MPTTTRGVSLERAVASVVLAERTARKVAALPLGAAVRAELTPLLTASHSAAASHPGAAAL